MAERTWRTDVSGRPWRRAAVREYLPTHYVYAWADLLSHDVDWGDIACGVLSALIYAVIAIRHFNRKDITS